MQAKASSEVDQVGSKGSWTLAILPPGGHGSLLRHGVWEVWRGIFIRMWAGAGQFEEQSPSPGTHSTSQGPKEEGERRAGSYRGPDRGLIGAEAWLRHTNSPS